MQLTTSETPMRQEKASPSPHNFGYRNPSIESDERLQTRKNIYHGTTNDMDDSYQQF